LKILSWNIQKKDLSHYVRELLDFKKPDILILNESEGLTSSGLLSNLNNQFENNGDKYSILSHSDSVSQNKITVIHRNSLKITHKVDLLNSRVSVFQLILPLEEGVEERILLLASHFPSKLSRSEHGQMEFVISLHNSIKRLEDDLSPASVIIIGDLNLEPFERSIYIKSSLFSTRSKKEYDCASTFYEDIVDKYYNPFWTLLGDKNNEVYGTYIYQKTWRLFDQALLKGAIVERVNKKKVEIIDKIKMEKLVDLDAFKIKHSDHLPISLELSEKV